MKVMWLLKEKNCDLLHSTVMLSSCVHHWCMVNRKIKIPFVIGTDTNFYPPKDWKISSILQNLMIIIFCRYKNNNNNNIHIYNIHKFSSTHIPCIISNINKVQFRPNDSIKWGITTISKSVLIHNVKISCFYD